MIDFLNSKIIIRKQILNICLFFLGINILAILSFGVVFNSFTDYIDDQLNANILEYGEIDREQLCKISNCIEVYSSELNKVWRLNDSGHLKQISHKHKIFKISEKLYVSDKIEAGIYNELSQTFYFLDSSLVLDDYIYLMSIFVPVSLILFLFPLVKSIKEEYEENIVMQAGNEALLANKTMINITENIHHELNTPIEVIDNKIEKIRRFIKYFLIEEAFSFNGNETSETSEKTKENLRNLDADFEFIVSSSEQIYAVLEKMKGFKHLRYSNGNKTLKNIIEGGFKIINMSTGGFSYKLDPILDKFRLQENSIRNADLLSVILNHIKNSLEANSSKIYIAVQSVNRTMISIRIMDNGNGIPEEAQKSIFKPNFTTKSCDSGVRGNGMYLNHHILKNAGGDLKLISSTPKGTTLELSFPIREA